MIRELIGPKAHQVSLGSTIFVVHGDRDALDKELAKTSIVFSETKKHQGKTHAKSNYR